MSTRYTKRMTVNLTQLSFISERNESYQEKSHQKWQQSELLTQNARTARKLKYPETRKQCTVWPSAQYVLPLYIKLFKCLPFTACVWPALLKLGCLTKYNILLLVKWFIFLWRLRYVPEGAKPWMHFIFFSNFARVFLAHSSETVSLVFTGSFWWWIRLFGWWNLNIC